MDGLSLRELGLSQVDKLIGSQVDGVKHDRQTTQHLYQAMFEIMFNMQL